MGIRSPFIPRRESIRPEEQVKIVYTYQAQVLRVIDGDTVELDIDLGFDIRHRCMARLRGINAPEVTGATKESGLMSRDALKMMLGDGRVVVTTEYHRERDKYGRCLVQIQKDGININQKMIDEGYAVVYMAEKA
jgi:micrococcal nuclease